MGWHPSRIEPSRECKVEKSMQSKLLPIFEDKKDKSMYFSKGYLWRKKKTEWRGQG